MRKNLDIDFNQTLSNYGIVGVNKGLFTNDCKKALKYV